MIAWAVETLIATTVLMLLVLVIRGPVRRAFGPDMAYALWALPVLRMLLPPMPESWRESAAAPITQASDAVVSYVIVPLSGVPAEAVATSTAPAATSIDIWPIIFTAWALGALGFIVYHLITHSRFTARIRRMAGSARIVTANNVEVIETGAASGPLAFGIVRKYVAFPRDFAERYDEVERDLALAHELGHHARGDLIANWVALIVLGLHWFNPVAWRAFRAFRADQEMACDALVLSGRDAALRHAYGRAIVKSAHGGAVSAACHLHTINEIKGRLRMLTKHEATSRRRRMIGGAALATLTLTGLAVTASGTQAAERVRTGIAETTGVDIAALELPQVAPVPDVPPVPEAAPAPDAPPAPEGIKKKVRVIVVRDKDGKVTTKRFEGDDADDIDEIASEDGVKVRTKRYVFRDKDGKMTSWNGFGPMPPMPPMAPMPPEALAALKNMPQISSRNCTISDGGGANEVVVNTKDGKTRKLIICTNRIEAMARDAEQHAKNAQFAAVDAEKIEREAKASAIRGLRSARDSIASSKDIPTEARAEALREIDQAIRDTESGKDDD